LNSKTGGKKMTAVSATSRLDDLALISELLQTGKIKSVIDRRYPLSDAAGAFRYLGEGHARGKIVIAVKE
jgi:NADPH:quinone reductase-like Zn-dependent oxidoreductase